MSNFEEGVRDLLAMKKVELGAVKSYEEAAHKPSPLSKIEAIEQLRELAHSLRIKAMQCDENARTCVCSRRNNEYMAAAYRKGAALFDDAADILLSEPS